MGDISTNFSRSEFACKCNRCGQDTVDVELIKVLEEIRAHFGKPVVITSGYRCQSWNAHEGGAITSQHIYGRAADFYMPGVKPVQVIKWLDENYRELYGVGLYSTWVHLDTRTNGPARWG